MVDQIAAWPPDRQLALMERVAASLLADNADAIAEMAKTGYAKHGRGAVMLDITPGDSGAIEAGPWRIAQSTYHDQGVAKRIPYPDPALPGLVRAYHPARGFVMFISIGGLMGCFTGRFDDDGSIGLN